MINTLILLSLSLTDPNTLTIQDFARHWLEKVVPINVNPNSQRLIGPVKRYSDGSWVRISSLSEPNRPFNLWEFCDFAKKYPGDPNYIPPVKPAPPEPNYPPAVPELIDPNLLNFVTETMEK